MPTITKEIKKDIMATDVYISVSSNSQSEDIIKKDVEYCVEQLRLFEKRFSRFLPDNELYILNNSSSLTVSDDMLQMLLTAKIYNEKTQGLFDPTILNALLNEGYTQSMKPNIKLGNPVYQSISTNSISSSSTVAPISSSSSLLGLSQVTIEASTKKVTKPKELHLDLGGIGKGYIADKLRDYLLSKYSDFCISIGGDMFVSGRDVEMDYEFWGIEIENPFSFSRDTLNMATVPNSMPLLLLSNQAVATSGIYKRYWKKGKLVKNHIIDPRTNTSVDNEIVSVTVLASSVIDADINAKTILILGLESGKKYCDTYKVPAVIVTTSGQVLENSYVKEYIWQN